MPRITKKMELEIGALEDPGQDNYRCKQCQLCELATEPFKMQTEPKNMVQIISSSSIDRNEKIWYDIRQLLFKSAGLAYKKNLVITGATLCATRKKPTALQLQMCKPFIARQFTELSPKKVMVMGSAALTQAMDSKTSIRSMIGGEHQWNGTPLYVTYDPSAAFGEKPEYLVTIKNHVYRMMKGQQRRLPEFPGYNKRPREVK